MLERGLRAANMAVDVFDADEPALAALWSKSPDVMVSGRRTRTLRIRHFDAD